MKYQVALVLLTIGFVCSQFTCPKFKCGAVSEPSMDEVCSKKTDVNNETTFNLLICSAQMTQVCGFNFASSLSNCTNSTIASRSLLPGEPCQYSDNCYSGSCLAGFCVGAEVGYACKNHIECRAGAFCSSQGKCELLAKEGFPCGWGKAACANHLTCNSGTCVPIGSLEIGAASDNQLACKTMYVALDTEGVFRCVTGPQLRGYTDKLIECTIGTMCEYSFNYTELPLSLPCKCGVNGDGKGYCRPGEGNMKGDIEKV